MLLVFAFAWLASCGSLNAFKRHDHFSSVAQRSYSNKELVLADYFFCAHQRKMALALHEFEKLEINADSVMGLFYKGISNQGVSFSVSDGQNRTFPQLCDREYITLRRAKLDFLPEADLCDRGTRYIVPVVQIADRYGFTAYVTSGGMGGSSGFMRFTSLFLLLFVVEDGEIIYADSRSFFSKTTMAPTLEEVKAIPPAYQVREEHIEELVRRGMRRYVRRLEK